ncbi:hypothetical protein FACS1894111_11110 [Clostridia bacterium]|nr:hypothetical protein FACS1894111_11110 [Clostridia bacterium]
MHNIKDKEISTTEKSDNKSFTRLLPIFYLALLLTIIILGIVDQMSDVSENTPLHVNLMAVDSYGANGFDERYLDAGYNSDALKKIHSKEESPATTYQVSKFGLENAALGFFDNPAREYTLAFDFNYTAEAMQYLKDNNTLPQIALHNISDNYEVFINGHKIVSELYLDDKDSIRLHKQKHLLSRAFNSDYIHEGANRLTLRIFGDPASSEIGINSTNAYIDSTEIVENNESPAINILMIGMYLFIGAFYLINSMLQREKHYLYFAISSLSLASYLLLSSGFLDSYVSQSLNITRATLLSFAMTVAFWGCQFDFLGGKKVSRITKIYMAICSSLILLLLFSGFGMKLWIFNISMLIIFSYLIYLVIYSVWIQFVKKIRSHAYGNGTVFERIKKAISRDVLCHVALATVAMLLGGLYEFADELILHTGVSIIPYFCFLLVIAISFGYSIVSAHDRTAITKRLKQEKMLGSISKNILIGTDMTNLIENALGLVGVFVGASRVLIAVADKEKDVFHPAYYWCGTDVPVPASVSGLREKLDRFFPDKMPEESEMPIIYCNNILTEKSGKFDFLKETDVKAFLWTPIYINSEFYGLFVVDDNVGIRRSWEESESLVSMVNGILSSAIARDLAERDSETDPLTGLPNRRKFNKHIEKEWERAIRVRTPISFMMLDVDKFKVYNDTYGHPQGDELLKSVAEIFFSVIQRPEDLVARLGGEEFGILLPNTILESALHVAEKVRARTEAMRVVTLTDNIVTTATISIGVVSVIPQLGDTIEDFIERADKNLYTAKESGRNRVCSDELQII